MLQRKKVGRVTINKNPKMKVLGVDFDGTLCQMFHYGTPYVPKQVINDKPNREVINYCNALHKRGVKIVIHSSRWWGEFEVIKAWLKKNGVKYDDIVLGKFKADAYLDDIGVSHVLNPDNWKQSLNSLLFKNR